jgi:putative ABC transport system substrate-binding protein
MRRRDFIAALGGAAMMPLASHAQERERIRRVGVLMNLTMDDPEAHARLGAFSQGMQERGWSIGRNLRIEYRWAVTTDRIREAAAELVALAPDVILVNATTTVIALQQASRSVPIVFASGADPVGMGIAQSLARPGGNVTGFISAEFGLSEKWLELLKQLVPSVQRVAVFNEPRNAGAMPQFAAVQTVARSFNVEVSPIEFADAMTIERNVGDFARNWGDDCAEANGSDRSSRSDHRLGSKVSASGSLSPASFRQRWWSDVLWSRHCGPIPACCRLRRSYPQR